MGVPPSPDTGSREAGRPTGSRRRATRAATVSGSALVVLTLVAGSCSNGVATARRRAAVSAQAAQRSSTTRAPTTGSTTTTATSVPASSTTTTAPRAIVPTGSTVEVTQGAPGAAVGLGDPYFPALGNPGYDVVSYDLALRLGDDFAALDATATVTATATAPLDTVRFDLRGLDVHAVTVDGREADAVRRDGIDLVVTPAEPLDKGATFKVSIAYGGRPQPVPDPEIGTIGWTTFPGGVVVAAEPDAASSWFPCNDHPSDKALFRFDLSVPRDVGTDANGVKTAVIPDGEHTRWLWETKHPMATYLATIAVGQFTILESTTPAGLNLTSVIADKVLDDGTAAAQDAGAMIDYFDDLFGPYPMESYGITVVPLDLDFALETQTRSLFGLNLYKFGSIRAHELAHQWFGDAVTPRTWADIWLNEGFATYAEWLWDEHVGGTSVEAAAGAVNGLDSPVVDPGRQGLFGSSVYQRGAVALHEMRRLVGDAVFFAILQRWVAEHRDGVAGTDDFIALVEKVTGSQWDDFFNRWLRQPTFPTR